VECIVAHDSTEGRLDHIFANIDTLFQAPGLTAFPLYLISGETLSCMLRPGKNVIEVNEACAGRWCSLVPIGHPCSRVTTTGLKYNLCEYWGVFVTAVFLVVRCRIAMLEVVSSNPTFRGKINVQKVMGNDGKL